MKGIQSFSPNGSCIVNQKVTIRGFSIRCRATEGHEHPFSLSYRTQEGVRRLSAERMHCSFFLLFLFNFAELRKLFPLQLGKSEIIVKCELSREVFNVRFCVFISLTCSGNLRALDEPFNLLRFSELSLNDCLPQSTLFQTFSGAGNTVISSVNKTMQKCPREHFSTHLEGIRLSSTFLKKIEHNTSVNAYL